MFSMKEDVSSSEMDSRRFSDMYSSLIGPSWFDEPDEVFLSTRLPFGQLSAEIEIAPTDENIGLASFSRKERYWRLESRASGKW